MFGKLLYSARHFIWRAPTDGRSRRHTSGSRRGDRFPDGWPDGHLGGASSGARRRPGVHHHPVRPSYILEQIKIAEAHVANTTSETGPCGALLGTGAHQIPSPLLPFGLRTVDGSCNNLAAWPGDVRRGGSGVSPSDHACASAQPSLCRSTPTAPVRRPPATDQLHADHGKRLDSEPRTISNLIVDQTSDNPAAVAAAGFPLRTQGNLGIQVCTAPGVPVDCVPEHQTLFIPNVTTDVGLSPPYN